MIKANVAQQAIPKTQAKQSRDASSMRAARGIAAHPATAAVPAVWGCARAAASAAAAAEPSLPPRGGRPPVAVGGRAAARGGSAGPLCPAAAVAAAVRAAGRRRSQRRGADADGRVRAVAPPSVAGTAPLVTAGVAVAGGRGGAGGA